MSAHARHHPLPTTGDYHNRWADWLSDRIFNDRELDHGLLMVLLATWIACFSGTLREASWWSELFHIMPPWRWAGILSVVGTGRIFLSRFGRGKRLATIALVSTFVFGFMGFIVAMTSYQITVTPLFFWLAYQSGKSYLRQTLLMRQAGA